MEEFGSLKDKGMMLTWEFHSAAQWQAHSHPACSLFLPEFWECPRSWGGVGWVWLGQVGGDRDTGGLRAFPRYCLVLTPPSQPLHAQFEGSSQQGGELAIPCFFAEQRVPFPFSRGWAGAEGAFGWTGHTNS